MMLFTKKPFLKKVFRILSYSKRHLSSFILLLVLTTMASAIALVNPYLVKILIDDVFMTQNFRLLYMILMAFLGMFVAGSFISIALSYVSTGLNERLVLDVKKELFEHLGKLHIGFYHSKRVGDIMSRLNDDVYGFEGFLQVLLNRVLIDLVTGAFILTVCFKLNAKVTGMALLFIPFYIVVQKYYGKEVRIKRQQIRKKAADIMSFLQEDISGIKSIQSFAREKLELNKYAQKAKRLIGLDLEMSILRGHSSMWMGFVSFVPLFIILLYGGFNVMVGALTVGTLIAIYTYIQQLFGPVSDLGNINVALQSTLVSVDRVFEFLDIEPKIKDSKDAKKVEQLDGKIEFKNVSFNYGDKQVLDDISFKIKPGEKVGLVGTSGSGKSTIVSMIPRFEDPAKGKVLLDGMDVKTIKLNSLRTLVGAVGEDSGLFGTTVEENIKFGNPDAKKEEIIQAAKLADAHNFIMKLPQKYKTTIGEKGGKLSSGQKQRIALARVLLTNPDIYILDEATSSVDTKSANKILKGFYKHAKDNTALLISHNLPALKKTDRIIVLKNGKLVEDGAFSDLLKKKGIFYKMYEAGTFEKD